MFDVANITLVTVDQPCTKNDNIARRIKCVNLSLVETFAVFHCNTILRDLRSHPCSLASVYLTMHCQLHQIYSIERREDYGE
jgi:hypothetical protein